MYNKINSIWEKGIGEAIKAVIERKKTESVEDILFNVWSNTAQKVYALFDAEEDWKSTSKEEKLKAFSNRTFSLENFINEVLRKMN